MANMRWTNEWIRQRTDIMNIYFYWKNLKKIFPKTRKKNY